MGIRHRSGEVWGTGRVLFGGQYDRRKTSVLLCERDLKEILTGQFGPKGTRASGRGPRRTAPGQAEFWNGFGLGASPLSQWLASFPSEF